MIKKKRKSNARKNRRVAVLIAAGILIAAIVTVSIVVLHTRAQNASIMENDSALAGITVNGIDISDMTYQEALTVTASIPESLMGGITVTIDVQGETHPYTAEELGFYTDYDDVMQEAILYGHTGTLEERKQAIETAKAQGVAFTVNVYADREKVSQKLLALKAELDTQPVNASATFMPWGYLADGTAYTQDEKAMIEAAANGKMWERPDLVRISEQDLPNALRYKFWDTDEYSSDNIPQDANIARFLYTAEQSGRSVDMETVVNSVMNAVETGDYSVIMAPVNAVEPTVTLESLKANTQLISSWTSSYSSHYGYNRNWNVAKLSGVINGVTIEPGQEWSINAEAGNRTVSSGWKEAAGIVNGGYVQQAGGGVCQISSTLYNAAIRANLNITDSTHHSISSDYIPLGLDATISSGSPDLKMKNDFSVPVYIVSYVDPKAKTATVEVYGPTVVDETYGDVILDFSFVDGGKFGEPVMTFIYDTMIAPEDGTVILPGAQYPYAQPRPGKKVTTYIHYLSPEGTELGKKEFHSYTWQPKNGRTYVNGTDPALATPTPAPTESATLPVSTPAP